MSAHIGTRDARAVSSHAQKHFIRLYVDMKPLPPKVAESGLGYTLSGMPPLSSPVCLRAVFMCAYVFVSIHHALVRSDIALRRCLPPLTFLSTGKPLDTASAAFRAYGGKAIRAGTVPSAPPPAPPSVAPVPAPSDTVPSACVDAAPLPGPAHDSPESVADAPMDGVREPQDTAVVTSGSDAVAAPVPEPAPKRKPRAPKGSKVLKAKKPVPQLDVDLSGRTEYSRQRCVCFCLCAHACAFPRTCVCVCAVLQGPSGRRQPVCTKPVRDDSVAGVACNSL